jgi:hypothetical protein
MLNTGGDTRYRNWMNEVKSEQMEAKGVAAEDNASFPVNSPLHWASFKVVCNRWWCIC